MEEPPSRPDSHVIGDIGVTTAALILKGWGWTADFITSDYGEDLDCNIFVESRRTALHFRCQVKSSRIGHYVRKLKSGDFSVSINTSTAKAWIFGYFPVLLIVYDDSEKELYWTNATEKIRDRAEALSQRTMSIRISSSAVLRKSRTEIENVVRKFYGSILRLSSPIFTCKVFPILMPGYRALPLRTLLDLPEPDVGTKISCSEVNVSTESLPAWSTTLRTLFPATLHGWKLSSRADGLEKFLQNMRKLFRHTKLKVESNEWISFVCSPIHLTSKDEDRSREKFWHRELVNWWSYSLIKSSIVSDLEYAFKVPTGFLRQVGRRARSWETFHHVNPKRDIAIELFATIATTPSYKAEVATLRGHMLSKFFLWTCTTDEVELLREMLSPIDLIFREVKGLQTKDDIVTGVICTPIFEPSLGLFQMALNWSEFSRGSVVAKLEESSLLDAIPGKPGSEDLQKAIVAMFGDAMIEPPDHILISERNFIPGLPIDHSERLISVQRFRMTERIDTDSARQKLEECSNRITSSLTDPEKVKNIVEVFEKIEGIPLHRLSIIWAPDLNESSSESFNRFSDAVIHTFNEIFPKESSGKNRLKSTYEILRYYGELHFEDRFC